MVNAGASYSCTAYIDHIRITVYYTSTAGDSCTYTSGNWNVQCSHYCNLTTNTNILKNNITFNGTGTVQITSNLTNFTKMTVMNSCTVRVSGGNRIGK